MTTFNPPTFVHVRYKNAVITEILHRDGPVEVDVIFDDGTKAKAKSYRSAQLLITQKGKANEAKYEA